MNRPIDSLVSQPSFQPFDSAMTHDPAAVELSELIGIFFEAPDELGEFTLVEGKDLPQPQRSLLNHHHHMTVTVERHHGCMVDVDVLQHVRSDEFYSREILLRRQSDRAVVLYGIVRIRLDALPPDVRELILARGTPLGRVLIEHDVMRRVELMDLFSVQPGPRLREILGVDSSNSESRCYGRTAMIHVDSKPTIELLEVVP